MAVIDRHAICRGLAVAAAVTVLAVAPATQPAHRTFYDRLIQDVLSKS